MPNDWFQFKQFKIHQDKCAMKVSTDACIQGAWAAVEFAEVQKPDAAILDIGAGTGLLTLMTAQALPDAYFDAIEINEEAYIQAVSNFEQSPWKHQIKAHHTSLADFTAPGKEAAFDFIICNPPFFQNHLESQSKARNDARHSQSLSKEELAKSAFILLKNDGIFCVMFPATDWSNWMNIASAKGLYLFKQLIVSPSPTSKPNRIIGLFSKDGTERATEKGFAIYDEGKKYTEEMKLLLKDYYLAF